MQSFTGEDILRVEITLLNKLVEICEHQYKFFGG